MKYKHLIALPLILGGAIFSATASASSLGIGYISYNVTAPDSTAEFDIVNLTGANSSGDAFFPVSTTVLFSNLSLLVDFSDGSSTTYGSSYFTTSPFDSTSFDGGTIAIGGGNAQPIEAILTGTLSPLSLTLFDSSSQTILPTFSATIFPSFGRTINDGDLSIINATTTGGVVTVPEPGTWLLLVAGILGLTYSRGAKMNASTATAKHNRNYAYALFTVFATLAAPASWATSLGLIGLTASASPSTGVAGVTNVNLTGTGFPSSAIAPANVSVSLMTGSCSGPVAKSTKALSITSILPGTKRVQFQIPEELTQGDYYVNVSDSTDGLTSRNCSQLHVTHTNATISACLPTSSLAVSTGTKVTAYVPKGSWSYGTTGVSAVPIEGGGAPTAIPTAQVVNSCSSNPATGQTVCTSNQTDVYLINGTALTNTLTSSANAYANFTGGSCQNCGVAINALTNKAIIGIGLSPSPSNSGLQVLDLNSNTFSAPVASTHIISEDISIDPTRGLLLSPGEDNSYTVFKMSPTGALTEYGNPTSVSGEFDSAAEDCTTGIALATEEFSGNLYLTDLTQAVFTAGSPGTWTAPGASYYYPEFANFSAGTSGISIAPGSSHQGIVAGEFGGNTFGVIQLPSTSGSGTPAVTDYAAASLPNTPDGNYFSAGYDPHTLTAYTSPTDGRAYGVISNGAPSYLAIIDLQKLLAAPRVAGSHYTDPSYDLIANGVVRFVSIN